MMDNIFIPYSKMEITSHPQKCLETIKFHLNQIPTGITTCIFEELEFIHSFSGYF